MHAGQQSMVVSPQRHNCWINGHCTAAQSPPCSFHCQWVALLLNGKEKIKRKFHFCISLGCHQCRTSRGCIRHSSWPHRCILHCLHRSLIRMDQQSSWLLQHTHRSSQLFQLHKRNQLAVHILLMSNLLVASVSND